MKGSVLLACTNPDVQSTLRGVLEAAGHRVEAAPELDDAKVRLGEGVWDVVLTDVDAADDAALSMIEDAKTRSPTTSILMLTTLDSIDRAVAAIDHFADGYLAKPVHAGEVRAVVRRAIEHSRLGREAESLRENLAAPGHFEGLVGDHPSMQDVFRTITQVAKSRATVVISGETGTGKELIARAIHFRSPRRGRPFVRLNCAALAESLLESELFGHEKGAYTGAAMRRAGRFEQADGGTLFLDEVSEIPPTLQVKLLRFLQEREFERVGGNETLRVDVRVVAATNKSLEPMVEEERFREDLYYRLHVVEIKVPPLRARPSDIPTLADTFLRKYAAENDAEVVRFTPEAIQAMSVHPWPGNVRELENAVERAVVMCEGPEIGLELLPAVNVSTDIKDIAMFVPGLSMDEIERIAILRTFDACGGSTRKAAELLGMSRRKIQYKLKEWGVELKKP